MTQDKRMFCYIKLMIIFAVCIAEYSAANASIALSKAPPYKCRSELTLICQISGENSCCSFTRFWRKDNEQIMSNEVVINSNLSGKYSGNRFDAEDYFTLTINNLNEDDFGTKYTCLYKGAVSPAVTVITDDLICWPCWKCVLSCFLYCGPCGSSAGATLNFNIILICICCGKKCCKKYCSIKFDDNNLTLFGKEYKKETVKKAFLLAIVSSILGHILIFAVIPPLTIGVFCYICYYNNAVAMMSFGLGFLLFFIIFYWALEFKNDSSFSWKQYIAYVIATFLVYPLWIPFLYHYKFHSSDEKTRKKYKVIFLLGVFVDITVIVLYIFKGCNIIYKRCRKGENSQSVESGSSCWPICRVGQDPNTSSSDPEKVRRSSKKESADKKPTGFVRPQPSRAQHLGTDNTGRAEYSAEDEIYSEKILKSKKPRLLPSIGHQDSPRPLPQMPASAQQGGNQLAPLEKKKKKRKKKREAKQSDEENSTEL